MPARPRRRKKPARCRTFICPKAGSTMTLRRVAVGRLHHPGFGVGEAARCGDACRPRVPAGGGAVGHPRAVVVARGEQGPPVRAPPWSRRRGRILGCHLARCVPTVGARRRASGDRAGLLRLRAQLVRGEPAVTSVRSYIRHDRGGRRERRRQARRGAGDLPERRGSTGVPRVASGSGRVAPV